MTIAYSKVPSKRQRVIDALLLKLKTAFDDLSNAEKLTLAEYIETLEQEIQACIKVANAHGFNNGKPEMNGLERGEFLPMSAFFSGKCEELIQAEVDAQLLLSEIE